MLPLQPPSRRVDPGYPQRSQALKDDGCRRRLHGILTASILGLALGGCAQTAAQPPPAPPAGAVPSPPPAQPQALPGEAPAPLPAVPQPLGGRVSAPAEPAPLRGDVAVPQAPAPQPVPPADGVAVPRVLMGVMAVPPPPSDPA